MGGDAFWQALEFRLAAGAPADGFEVELAAAIGAPVRRGG
jgi:hypothetical protein